MDEHDWVDQIGKMSRPVRNELPGTEDEPPGTEDEPFGPAK